MKVLFSPENQKERPLWNKDKIHPSREKIVELLTKYGLHNYIATHEYPKKYGGQYNLYERTCLILPKVLHFCLNEKEDWVQHTIAIRAENRKKQKEDNQRLFETGQITEKFVKSLADIVEKHGGFDRKKAEFNYLVTIIWSSLMVDETGPLMEFYAKELINLMTENGILDQLEDEYQITESGKNLLENLTDLLGVRKLLSISEYDLLCHKLLKYGYDYFDKYPEEMISPF